jgi:cell division protein FtsW
MSIAEQNTGEPMFFVMRHLAALGIGLVGALFMLAVPSDIWFRHSPLLLVAGLALLGAVLIPGFGHTVNGSTRWLAMGPFRLQASEPARLCLIMYLASYGVRHTAELSTTFKSFLKPLLIVGIAGVLLLAEPDFGAAVVITLTSLGILFVAGSRLRDFLLAVVSAAAILACLVLTSPYRWQRVTSYWRPFDDPFDTGFQLANSLIAIGRGEWLGVGLGESIQKLFYLPEAHTDFVFAVLAEELGLVGSLLVIVLFSLVVYRALVTGQRAMDAGLPFQGLLCVGIGVMIGIEAFINVGVNTGLLPTKGLTLPLISYGRSSVIVTMVALGLVLRVNHELYGSGQGRDWRRRRV